jgi:predicted lactoylglutathione lyase
MTTTTTIESIMLESGDPDGTAAFHAAAFGLGDRVRVRATDAPTSGFRGYLLSLVVAQPSTVDSLVGSAVDGGATVVKPPAKSFWGYGGMVQAPDGAIWKIATSAKKDTGPATREIDDVVLLLGVDDVKATRRFYTDRGLTVARGFGSKYVEFDTAPVKLALYSRRAAAKDAGVPADGTGSHRLVILGEGDAYADPDGFCWETATATGPARLPAEPAGRVGA